MTTEYTFTVEEILAAAEKNKYPNFNDHFLDVVNNKTVRACVIGEAFLNLGMVPNGITPSTLSHALRQVMADGGKAVIPNTDEYAWGGLYYYNLSDFINDLNNYPRFRGKKRLANMAREFFSESLNQTVTITEEMYSNEGYSISPDRIVY